MSYRFLSPALLEVSQAAEFYEERVAGLGADFMDEVDAAIDRILQFPEAWGRLGRNYGAVVCGDFPI
jgi:toxin ParE1/3/4